MNLTEAKKIAKNSSILLVKTIDESIREAAETLVGFIYVDVHFVNLESIKKHYEDLDFKVLEMKRNKIKATLRISGWLD